MADRYIWKIFRLDDAVKNNDWEKVSFLIILNPDIMEDGLKRVYPLLPDECKRKIDSNPRKKGKKQERFP